MVYGAWHYHRLKYTQYTTSTRSHVSREPFAIGRERQDFDGTECGWQSRDGPAAKLQSYLETFLQQMQYRRAPNTSRQPRLARKLVLGCDHLCTRAV